MAVGVGDGLEAGPNTRYAAVSADGRSMSSSVGVTGILVGVAVRSSAVGVAEGHGVGVGTGLVGVGTSIVGVGVGTIGVGTVGVGSGNALLGLAAAVGLAAGTVVGAVVEVATGAACGPHPASDRTNASSKQQMRARNQTGIIDRAARSSASSGGSSLSRGQGQGQHTAD